MTNSLKLTRLELVLIQLVAKGNGNWSWYEIASHLSRLDVPREPDMMVVLKKLAAEGLLKRYVQTGSPRDRWELTSTGVLVVEAEQTKRKKIYKRTISRSVPRWTVKKKLEKNKKLTSKQ